MNWFLLAIISIVTISIANLFQRVVMKEPESDPLGSSIFFQFILAFITGLFALLKGFTVPPIFQYPLNFVVSSCFYALGTLSFFKAAKKIGASEITILTSLGTIVTIVGAVVFLGETFTLRQFIATLLILGAVIMAQGKIIFSKNVGSFYAVLGTSFYGLAVVSDTHILKNYDAISYTPIISLLPGVILLIANPKVISRFKKFANLKYLKNIFLYSFFYGLQAITYYLALNYGANASQMAPLFRAEIILTVLLAAVFLRERERLGIKAFSALIVISGLILIR
ncbi:hypothetical protein A3A66_03325 [Microgenomates group bacterium RIFCSPLOWO2_01_FULL_46_13]|nr:MAG: hypothetical protein A2783_04500 [Microgenomates group bacterium RIFCSPHIGHO2_01_FULL_45_11]OGV95024.1 MAG: hypothetical protein A3A66_03325 [Microgenomates group bacterium RIFCSPLOWO2_01_FULL_46_13]